MARETNQRDKRTQPKPKTSASTQTTQSSRANASDRQTPIQTGRDANRSSGQNQPDQAAQSIPQSQATSQSPTNQLGRQSQSSQPIQQSGSLARRGMSAPVRAGISNPFELMQRMSEDMDRLFGQFGFGRSGFGLNPIGLLGGSDIADQSQGFGSGPSLWIPQVETTQRGDRFVVRADLPGIKKDDVRVEVDDDVLTISGERRNEQRDERDGFFRSELSYGSFFRAIPLPDGVRADQCEAKFNDGVLEISLPAPKQPDRSTRQIQIR
jgi:HSP20 family protein